MNRIRIAPAAGADLAAAFDYIASESEERRAAEVIDGILERVTQLAHFPRLGKSRKEVAGDWRVFAEGSDLIYYPEMEAGIEVLRVVHGRRDQASALATDR